VSALQHRRVQYGSERSSFLADLERDIDADSAIYPVAKIAAVADYVGRISDGLDDWPDATFFGVI
jgi:hypothetical protein